MTKTIKINCERCSRIACITLWALASFGISYGLYYGINYEIKINWTYCFDYVHHIICQPDSGFVLVLLAIIANIGNYCFMWKVINNKYNFIEIECTSENQ